MRRFELTDEQYARIEHLLPGKPGDPGATARDNRLFMDAIPWIARTGAPWPDLPERFGKYDTAYQRFNRRAKSGVLARVMAALGGDADLENLPIDSADRDPLREDRPQLPGLLAVGFDRRPLGLIVSTS